jgi:hypothetical protein
MNKHVMIALAVLEVVLIAIKLITEARDAKRRRVEQRFLVRVLGPGNVDPIADCRMQPLTWILVALVTFSVITSFIVR